MAEQPVERGGARPGGPSPAVAACHPPVAPVDERNPLKSLGEAVADTVTGSDADTSRDRKR